MSLCKYKHSAQSLLDIYPSWDSTGSSGGTGGGPFLGVPWLLGLFCFLLRQLDNIVLDQNSTVAFHCSITHHTIVIASLQLRVMYEREGVICEAQGPPGRTDSRTLIRVFNRSDQGALANQWSFVNSCQSLIYQI